MPSFTEMLHPRCPKHPEMLLEGGCAICTRETPQQREARMAEWRKRFMALVAAAERHGVPGYRSEAVAYGEGVEDDD